MSDQVPVSGTEIVDATVRAVLLRDWDPHNAAPNEAAHGTYDQYLAPLRALIERGGTEDEIVDFLYDCEKESMCFPSLGTQRLRRVARNLLRLREPPAG
ncbi:MAG: hypothetical protein JWO31_1182 [Phycisphaerales bacterium]|nr:hypothetical protein [Phycisphaerales bacterium]